MISTTLSAFKKHSKDYLEKVTEDFDTILIHTGKDKGLVMISIDDYQALMTTQAELIDPLNRRRLFESMAAFERGEGFQKDLLA